MLSKIFEMQRDLNVKIGRDTVGAPSSERDKWLFDYAFALSQEAGELLDCADWKWWSKTVKENPKRFKIKVEKENYYTYVDHTFTLRDSENGSIYSTRLRFNAVSLETGLFTFNSVINISPNISFLTKEECEYLYDNIYNTYDERRHKLDKLRRERLKRIYCK